MLSKVKKSQEIFKKSLKGFKIVFKKVWKNKNKS